MDRPQHRLLQVPILLRQLQDLRIHNSYDCWLISCSFSAAHPLHRLVAMHTQHSSNRKAKRRPMPHRRKHSISKVNPRPRCPHRRLSLPPPPRLRHLLLLMFIRCSKRVATPPYPSIADPFHSFSLLYIPPARRWVLTLQYSSSNLIIVIDLFTPRMCVFYFTTSSISGSV
ncbi:hypothetical protein F4604DRAFT_721868 [Suillus subluteus]|nr:hypothetical protein F4604DRAFT_721868 [Suillus subluteus]